MREEKEVFPELPEPPVDPFQGSIFQGKKDAMWHRMAMGRQGSLGTAFGGYSKFGPAFSKAEKEDYVFYRYKCNRVGFIEEISSFFDEEQTDFIVKMIVKLENERELTEKQTDYLFDLFRKCFNII
jgi:hypothetical protein